jgi:hypothetical protein
VTLELTWFVSKAVTLTSASTTAALDGSTTVPDIDPLETCASAIALASINIAIAIRIRERIPYLLYEIDRASTRAQTIPTNASALRSQPIFQRELGLSWDFSALDETRVQTVFATNSGDFSYMQLSTQTDNRNNLFIFVTIAENDSHARTESYRKAIEKYGI